MRVIRTTRDANRSPNAGGADHRNPGFAAAAAIVLASAALSTPPAAADARWSDHADDLPLPAAFEETGEGFAFETAKGSIVRVVAQGALDPGAAEAFYAQTLPQLGWLARRGEAAVYDRAGETLQVRATSIADGLARIEISIRPQTDAANR